MNHFGPNEDDDVPMDIANGEQPPPPTSWTINEEIAAAKHLASSLNSDGESLLSYNVDDSTAAAIAEAVTRETMDGSESTPSRSGPDSPSEIGETVGKRKTTAPSEYHMQFSCTDHDDHSGKSTKFNKVVHGENPLSRKSKDETQTTAGTCTGVGSRVDTSAASTRVAMLKLRAGSSPQNKPFGRGSKLKLKNKQERDKARIQEFREREPSGSRTLNRYEAIEFKEESRDANAPGSFNNPWH